MTDPATTPSTIGDKLLATVETAFRAFMTGREAPPLQPGDSTQAAWERFRACLETAERGTYVWRAVPSEPPTVSIACTCKLANDPKKDGAHFATNPRCKIHGTAPISPMVQAVRDGMPWKEAVAQFSTAAESVPRALSKQDAIAWSSRLGPAARSMVDLDNPRECADSFGEGPMSAPPEVYTAREIVRAYVRHLDEHGMCGDGSGWLDPTAGTSPSTSRASRPSPRGTPS